AQAGALAKKCDDEGFRWRLVPFDWAPGRVRRIWSLLRFARELRGSHPTVVLPYTALPNVVCNLTWRLAGARFCMWNQRAAHPYLRGSRLEALALRSAPCIVSNSEHAARELAVLHGLAADRIRVIRNGVELERSADGRDAWRE